MEHSERGLGLVAVALAAMLWGTTGTLQAVLPPGADPLAVGALRVAVGAAALLAVARLRPETVTRALPWPLVIFAGIAIGGYNLVFFWALTEIGVGIGTAIALGSAPLWATAYDMLIRKEPPTRVRLAGQAIAIAGLSMLMASSSGAVGSLFGIALAASAGACYVAYSLATSASQLGQAPLRLAAATFSVAAIVTAPVLFWSPLEWLAEPRSWAAILALGVIATAVSYALYTWGLGRVRASTAVTLALLEPVTAWVLATVVVGEPLSALKAAGAALILAGLLVITLRPNKR